MRKNWLLLLLAPALLLPALACGGKKETSESTSTQAPGQPTAAAAAPTRAANPSGAGVEGELAALVQGLKDLKTFKANIIIEAAGQPKQEGSIEAVLPDRIHITFPGAEVISIGSDLYLKAGPTWSKQAGGGLGAIFDLNQITDVFAGVDVSSRTTQGGLETIGGQRCQLYTVVTSDGTKSEVCVANNLPVRIISEAPGGGKFTIVFSSLNSTLEIRAPI